MRLEKEMLAQKSCNKLRRISRKNNFQVNVGGEFHVWIFSYNIFNLNLLLFANNFLRYFTPFDLPFPGPFF